MLQDWYAELALTLDTLKANSALRQRNTIESAQGSEIIIGGKRLINFSSNDYLGLANHIKIKQAFKRGVDQYGVGAGASHLVVGHSEAHAVLERQLAEFTGRDKAIVFSSGYMANLGVIQALMQRNDAIFADKLNHASLVDACVSSPAKLHRYRHGDSEHLRQLASTTTGSHAMLVTDGVFSMDGDCAPLPQLTQIAAEYSMLLMVDDAHGFGVLGPRGRGSLEHFGLSQQSVPLLMGTLGKAVGVAGAFVAGSSDIIETLVQRSRNYIYTTALPPASAMAISASLDIIDSEPERRTHLKHLVSRLREGLESIGIQSKTAIETVADTPIVPINLVTNERALRLSQYLFDNGVLAVAIRPPTVPVGSSRLRISLSAAHSDEHIDQLLNVLESGLATLPVDDGD